MNDIEGDWEGSHPNNAETSRSKFRKEHGFPDTPPSTAQPFPDAGQVFMRDRWGEDGQYLTFDATRWGGAHCHLARNSIALHAFGRTLLLDSGRMEPASSGASRDK